eukprot:6187867-Pleurochrysis_carterae.AAC.1
MVTRSVATPHPGFCDFTLILYYYTLAGYCCLQRHKTQVPCARSCVLGCDVRARERGDGGAAVAPLAAAGGAAVSGGRNVRSG